MEMVDKVLLGLVLGALAVFPLAVFFYLRTAYRQGGWTEVKTALAVAGMSLLVWAVFELWLKHMEDLIGRIIDHPFRATTILLILVSWLLHQAFKRWVGKTCVHD